METIPRHSQVSAAGSMACFLTAVVSRFAAFGFKAHAENSVRPSHRLSRAFLIDRELVLGDIVEHLQEVMWMSAQPLEIVLEFMWQVPEGSKAEQGRVFIIKGLSKRLGVAMPQDTGYSKLVENHLPKLFDIITRKVCELFGWDSWQSAPEWA